MRPKLLCLALMLSLFTLAQTHVQAAAGDPVAYTTFGIYNYTVPNGVVRLTVELWGAGGGGGGGADEPFLQLCLDHGGGGGGGGGYIRASFDVISGQVYTIIVGRGGQGGNPGAVGFDGDASSIRTSLGTILFSVDGGKGGSAGVTCEQGGAGGNGGHDGIGVGLRAYGGRGFDAVYGIGGRGGDGPSGSQGIGRGGGGGNDEVNGASGFQGRAVIIPQFGVPVALDNDYTGVRDFPLIIAAPGVLGNDVDPSNVGLAASVLTGPAHGTVNLNANGAFVYTPVSGYAGADNFTYNACDNTSQCDSAVVNINIRVTSELPFSRTSPGSYTFIAPARVTQIQVEAWGSGGGGGGGSETFSPFCLSYGGGGGGSGAFGRSVLNVTPGATYVINVGLPGTGGGISGSGSNGGSTEIRDASGALLFLVGGGFGGGGAPTCGGVGGGGAGGGTILFGVTTGITGGPGLNGFRDGFLGGIGGMGGGSFLNRADGAPGGDGAEFGQDGAPGQITIARLNSLPDALDDTDVTDEDTPITIDVLANDVDLDGDVLTIQSVSTPGHGTVAIVAGQVQYSPSLNYNGTDSFFYTITDGPNTDLARVDLTINPVNDPPFAENDFATTFSTVPVIITVLANDGDADGDGLFVTLGTGPANGTASVNSDGSITYTSALGFRGEDSFTYSIDDQEGGTASALVTVTVLNRPPDANDDSATTNIDVAVTIPVLGNDSDPDGDPVVLLSVGAAGNGTTTMNVDGTVTYTPNAGFLGTDSFSYGIGDGQGGGDSANVTVTVERIACDSPNPEADLTGMLLPETGFSTGRVTNTSLTCAYDIGIASYLKFDDVIDNQVLFASNMISIPPGQTVDISVGLPGCAAQIDLFYGPVLTSLNGVRYGEALMAGYQQPGAYCTAP